MQGVFHKHLDDKVRPCIDLIDSLRSFGVEEDLALPAIAVIGDQSSGKSSVLEALSGVALPRGSGIVTRCPLQLRLRSLRVGEKWKARISYKDTDGIDIHDPSQVEQHIINAQNALAGDGVGICEELITLEISSPDVCDLTLIDLPGIARVPVGDQPENIGEQTKHLISQFIRRNETIILVVVPCNIDIATTEALKMAKEVDPVGKRTLGILTKPDLVDRGTEQTILAVVRNQVIPLRKGYLLVKCRGQRQIDERVSLADVTQMERDFFEQHEFFKYLLREEKATTQCLASKLTEELVDQIKASLPSLSEQIQLQLHEVITELKQHDSGPPLEPEKMADYLSDILMAFNEKINALCTHGGVKRENLYSDLRPELSSWEAQLDESKEKFDAAVQAVVDGYEDQFRGRELPHFSDYNVFEAVVQDLVEKLKQPAMDTLKKTRQIVQKAFTSVAKTCFFQYPCLRNMALSKIDAIQTQQEAKVEKRIMEQFKMEQLVYTQDRIFHRVQEASGGSAEDCRAKYPNFLKSYYEVVYQRLADQVPMLILLFMLRESARLLSSEVIRLTYSTRVAELLREESEFSRRRIELLNRKNRLTKAQEKLNAFF